ncbi:hypothetical protein DESC_690069 [Desulfosarcina cetonica]|nr:hypothetical protein DESC_690069 [Desulfosarcina cetonica]
MYRCRCRCFRELTDDRHGRSRVPQIDGRGNGGHSCFGHVRFGRSRRFHRRRRYSRGRRRRLLDRRGLPCLGRRLGLVCARQPGKYPSRGKHADHQKRKDEKNTEKADEKRAQGIPPEGIAGTTDELDPSVDGPIGIPITAVLDVDDDLAHAIGDQAVLLLGVPDPGSRQMGIEDVKSRRHTEEIRTQGHPDGSPRGDITDVNFKGCRLEVLDIHLGSVDGEKIDALDPFQGSARGHLKIHGDAGAFGPRNELRRNPVTVLGEHRIGFLRVNRGEKARGLTIGAPEEANQGRYQERPERSMLVLAYGSHGLPPPIETWR